MTGSYSGIVAAIIVIMWILLYLILLHLILKAREELSDTWYIHFFEILPL
jgi:hypothetical protein